MNATTELEKLRRMATFSYDSLEYIEQMFHLRTKFAKDLLECDCESERSLTIKQAINTINGEIVTYLGICELPLSPYEKRVQESKTVMLYGNPTLYIKP